MFGRLSSKNSHSGSSLYKSSLLAPFLLYLLLGTAPKISAATQHTAGRLEQVFSATPQNPGYTLETVAISDSLQQELKDMITLSTRDIPAKLFQELQFIAPDSNTRLLFLTDSLACIYTDDTAVFIDYNKLTALQILRLSPAQIFNLSPDVQQTSNPIIKLDMAVSENGKTSIESLLWFPAIGKTSGDYISEDSVQKFMGFGTIDNQSYVFLVNEENILSVISYSGDLLFKVALEIPGGKIEHIYIQGNDIIVSQRPDTADEEATHGVSTLVRINEDKNSSAKDGIRPSKQLFSGPITIYDKIGVQKDWEIRRGEEGSSQYTYAYIFIPDADNTSKPFFCEVSKNRKFGYDKKYIYLFENSGEYPVFLERKKIDTDRIGNITTILNNGLFVGEKGCMRYDQKTDKPVYTTDPEMAGAAVLSPSPCIILTSSGKLMSFDSSGVFKTIHQEQNLKREAVKLNGDSVLFLTSSSGHYYFYDEATQGFHQIGRGDLPDHTKIVFGHGDFQDISNRQLYFFHGRSTWIHFRVHGKQYTIDKSSVITENGNYIIDKDQSLFLSDSAKRYKFIGKIQVFQDSDGSIKPRHSYYENNEVRLQKFILQDGTVVVFENTSVAFATSDIPDIEEKEVLSPEIKNKLTGYGISNLEPGWSSRFRNNIANTRDALANGDTLALALKPLVLVFNPRSDWNAAFMSSGIYDFQNFSTLYFERTNPSHIKDAVTQLLKYGDTQDIVIGGHGSRRRITPGNDSVDCDEISQALIPPTDSSSVNLTTSWLNGKTIYFVSCSSQALAQCLSEKHPNLKGIHGLKVASSANVSEGLSADGEPILMYTAPGDDAVFVPGANK